MARFRVGDRVKIKGWPESQDFTLNGRRGTLVELYEYGTNLSVVRLDEPTDLDGLDDPQMFHVLDEEIEEVDDDNDTSTLHS